MSASTTLKLPEPLKRRITPLAKAAGKTPHAWMIEALELQTVFAGKRRAFGTIALAAEKEVEGSAKAYRAEDVHRHVRALAAGKRAKRPKLATW